MVILHLSSRLYIGMIFCYKNDERRLYKYDCPLLRTTNTYNFIPVESIIELIQVVKRAEKQNEYFVNIYMF